MKRILLFAAIATAAFGKTFHGVAEAPGKSMFSKVEIVVIYDETGKSKLSLRWGEKDKFVDSDFVVTQRPAKQDSLIGYFIFEGAPVVVRIDTWSQEKRFYVYHTVIRPDGVFVGSYD